MATRPEGSLDSASRVVRASPVEPCGRVLDEAAVDRSPSRAGTLLADDRDDDAASLWKAIDEALASPCVLLPVCPLPPPPRAAVLTSSRARARLRRRLWRRELATNSIRTLNEMGGFFFVGQLVFGIRHAAVPTLLQLC